MRDKACIIKYENGIATVIPLLTDTCISCNSSTCAKRGTSFQASNPHNLQLRPGNIVKIEAPASVQIVQGLFSLILPILGAVAGFFLADPIASAIGVVPTEGMRAAGVLVMLALSTVSIFFLSKTLLRLTKAQVSAVLHHQQPITVDNCLL